MANILAINAGSSSIKFRLLAMPAETRLAGGSVDGVGSAQASLQFRVGDDRPVREALGTVDQAGGVKTMLERLGAALGEPEIDAAAHRLVHGGGLHRPVTIDEQAIEQLQASGELAPLHNAAGLAGIRLIHARYPDLPQVAVFDTAFHHDLPERARLYALPLALQRDHGIRRFGFHGLSNRSVVTAAARWLERPLDELRLITLHLGNGASASAIHNGHSVDTSMGFTPLEGLVMGTRCGDLDPALPGHLLRQPGWDPARVDKLLNRDSGLRGLCGIADMRQIEERMNAGDADARRAFELFCYRIRKYIGAYFAALNGADALIFTAGIGEHSAAVRATVCAELDALGIAVDEQRNAAAGSGIAEIGRAGMPVRVLVVPTDEELEIARAAYACLHHPDQESHSGATAP